MNKLSPLIILFFLIAFGQNLFAQRNVVKISFEDYEKEAEALVIDKNYDGAIDIYSKLLSQNPSKEKKYEYYLLTGDAYLSQKKYSNALSGYNSAAALYNRYEARLKIGDTLLKSDLFTLAERSFLDVLDKNKRSDFAKRRLGDIYLKQGIYLKSLQYYESVDHFYLDRATIINMSKAYRIVGQSEKAIELVRKYLRYSDDAEILFMLGVLYGDIGDYNKAEENFLASIAIDGSNYAAFLYAAAIYEGNQDLAKAKSFLLKASSLNPSIALTDLMLSRISYKMKDMTGAKKYALSAQKKADTQFMAQQAQRMVDFYNGK